MSFPSETYKLVYTRSHSAHAWKYERTVSASMAELEADVNKGFGLETLLVPAINLATLPLFLDSTQNQADFA